MYTQMQNIHWVDYQKQVRLIIHINNYKTANIP
jgi:hypothetical protein